MVSAEAFAMMTSEEKLQHLHQQNESLNTPLMQAKDALKVQGGDMKDHKDTTHQNIER